MRNKEKCNIYLGILGNHFYIKPCNVAKRANQFNPAQKFLYIYIYIHIYAVKYKCTSIFTFNQVCDYNYMYVYIYMCVSVCTCERVSSERHTFIRCFLHGQKKTNLVSSQLKANLSFDKLPINYASFVLTL